MHTCVENDLPVSDYAGEKNKRLLILLLLLIGATGTAFWLTAREDRTQTDKHLFKNFDLKTISQITLQKEGDTVNLVYTGARWMVNEKFPADPAMIEVLFATLQQAEPKRPLAATQTDSIGGLLRQKAVKVTLISNGSAVSSFFAGGNNAKNQAYFMQEGESTPYLMNIPGYRVYVSGIFELDESGWREKEYLHLTGGTFGNSMPHFPEAKRTISPSLWKISILPFQVCMLLTPRGSIISWTTCPC